MNFAISEEQKEMCNALKNYCKSLEWESKEFKLADWKKLAEFGLFGICVPEEYGGLGEKYLTAALLTETLGYVCENNGLIFAMNNHVWVAIELISLFGSEEQKREYLPSMIEGLKIGAMAITEADSGSDAYSMLTTGQNEDGCIVLNGSKMFISNGTIADVFIVFAKSSAGITAYIVDKYCEGFKVGKEIKKMGMDGCPMAEITFENCRINTNKVLGREGGGKKIIQEALEIERGYEFASHIGVMQRIMEKCILYSRERVQAGHMLSDYQAVSHKIADMKLGIEVARLLLYKYAWLKDKGKSAYLEASMFKLFCSETYMKTALDAVQIFGAYGYTKEFGLEKEVRDAVAAKIYSGTNEIQKNTIFALAQLDCV